MGNQVLCCIIYGRTKIKADYKLLEIEKKKNKQGISTQMKRISSNGRSEILFADQEKWVTVTDYQNVRGLRYTKAFIDYNIPEEDVKQYIFPYGIYKVEDEIFF